MIVSILNVTSSAEQRTEVFQTLSSLAPLIRAAPGCERCDLCHESGDETAFTLVEEWRSREEFDEHLRSRVFGVLLGLAPLLRRRMGVCICTVASREGMEAVRQARSHAVPH
jgi:quinol monooxygenase YgiN